MYTVLGMDFGTDKGCSKLSSRVSVYASTFAANPSLFSVRKRGWPHNYWPTKFEMYGVVSADIYGHRFSNSSSILYLRIHRD